MRDLNRGPCDPQSNNLTTRPQYLLILIAYLVTRVDSWAMKQRLSSGNRSCPWGTGIGSCCRSSSTFFTCCLLCQISSARASHLLKHRTGGISLGVLHLTIQASHVSIKARIFIWLKSQLQNLKNKWWLQVQRPQPPPPFNKFYLVTGIQDSASSYLPNAPQLPFLYLQSS